MLPPPSQSKSSFSCQAPVLSECLTLFTSYPTILDFIVYCSKVIIVRIINIQSKQSLFLLFPFLWSHYQSLLKFFEWISFPKPMSFWIQDIRISINNVIINLLKQECTQVFLTTLTQLQYNKGKDIARKTPATNLLVLIKLIMFVILEENII